VREKGLTGRPTGRTGDAGGSRKTTVSPEAYSFLLFGALTLSAVALFPGTYLLFVLIVTVDGAATLLKSDSMVSVDRSAFFLALLALSVARGSQDLFFLFLEMVLAIAALDITFLLRRLSGTLVDASVVRGRLVSYGYTLVPTLLLSYALTSLYSSISGSSPPDPLVLLAVSSTGALLSIYAVTRYLSPRKARPSSG
jgi:hypothetical protein